MSFSPLNKKVFDNDFFSLERPSNWRMSSRNYSILGTYNVSLTAKGMMESGSVEILGATTTIDLDEQIKHVVQTYEEAPIYKRMKIVHSPSRAAKFNNYPARAKAFKYRLMGLDYEGMYIALHAGRHTLCFRFEGAVEDREDNSRDFEFIEDSFKIK